MNTFKKNILPVIVLFVICVIITTIVGCTNLITEGIISENVITSRNETMKTLVPNAASFEEVTSVNALSGYRALDGNGIVIGYIFTTTGEGGYGGNITVMTALDAGGIVTGLEITEDTETPGLGKNAHKEAFRNQYVGKNVDSYIVKKGEVSADNEISALASATRTSTAVTNAVNLAKQAYHDVAQGEK